MKMLSIGSFTPLYPSKISTPAILVTRNFVKYMCIVIYIQNISACKDFKNKLFILIIQRVRRPQQKQKIQCSVNTLTAKYLIDWDLWSEFYDGPGGSFIWNTWQGCQRAYSCVVHRNFLCACHAILMKFRWSLDEVQIIRNSYEFHMYFMWTVHKPHINLFVLHGYIILTSLVIRYEIHMNFIRTACKFISMNLI